MADRILTASGKWEVYVAPKTKPEIKKVPKIENVAAIDSDIKKEEDVKQEDTAKVIDAPVTLTGDETVKELKLMLTERNVSFAKNAGADKCKELLAPFIVASEDEDDL